MSLVLVVLFAGAGVGEEKATPRRRPLSTPRVYDQAPTVVTVEELFGGGGTGPDRVEDPVEAARETVPRNPALDLPNPAFAPLIPVHTGSGPAVEEEDEEDTRWLRPADLLGDEDLAPVADEELMEEGAAEEPMEWESLREVMARREQEEMDAQLEAAQEAAAAMGAAEEEAVNFSVRDREASAGGLNVGVVERERTPGVQGVEGPGIGTAPGREGGSPELLPSSMRMGAVLGGAGERMIPEERATRIQPIVERSEAGFGGAAGGMPRASFTTEDRWAPREPLRVQRSLNPGSVAPPAAPVIPRRETAVQPMAPRLPQMPTRSENFSPPPAPTTPGLDIQRFRPEEFSIRPSNPWSTP